MKALTLHAAWAYAVHSLGKRVENRTWVPSDAMLGERIAIHAGLTVDADEVEEALNRWMIGRFLRGDACSPSPRGDAFDRDTMDAVRAMAGCVVGTAVLRGYVAGEPDGRVGASSGLTLDEARDALRSPWYAGTVGLVLADFVPCLVGPVRGRLGFWSLPPELEAKVVTRAA